MTGPLLFLIFNRPHLTARVFETIRAARPPRLYIAADGLRADRPDDAALCAAARAAATAIDWPCEVHTLFQPANLGCKRAVEAGIGWFFAHEPHGIILEDDMLPHPSFFPFVEVLLHRYANDPCIGIVSGLTLLPPDPVPRASYAFSNYFHMWGWGTWARVWAAHDPAMAGWPHARREGLIARVLHGRRIAVRYWTRVLGRTARGRYDCWDNQLQFSLWRAGLISIVPATNMVTNIGFAADATNSRGAMPGFMRRAVPREMVFPLVHPPVEVYPAFDVRIERAALRIGLRGELRAAARDLLAPLMPMINRLRYRR